ncbi:hypothetical protein AWJ07_07965 [Shewanella frigidimarina]|uniref:Uncharacterized protein n=1 Tax=Shewanella frigidimarina TaxID=56812 RepID=A0A106BX89_SHEFR|nr:hypothetical protein AWJ07_07965 [Shewanella frigidimarina]
MNIVAFAQPELGIRDENTIIKIIFLQLPLIEVVVFSLIRRAPYRLITASIASLLQVHLMPLVRRKAV